MNTKTEKTEKARPSSTGMAPRPLATPTDLTAQEVQAVTAAINPLIADSIALYVKLKNFHWHVVGSHFRDYHLMFDEHADEILASLDPLAERVRRIGGTTIRSMGHVQELTRVEDDDDEFVTPDAMINRLIKDNLHMAKQLRSAIELTEEKRDMPTNDLLMELLDATEKRIWFLHEISQGGENME